MVSVLSDTRWTLRHIPLRGAQSSGPIANPRTNNEMPKVPMICATWNSCKILAMPPEYAEEAKATASVAIATSIVIAHFIVVE